MAGASPLEIWEKPKEEELYMLAGWRQWADAGSISSKLPEYLIRRMDAQQIGTIRPDGFYLFQIPGTHDLVRPVVAFEAGYPVSLDTPHNDIYYAGDGRRGVIFFTGDEPHMDAERYVQAFLDIADELGVRRTISFGGVYGELPYDKERRISAIFSRRELGGELAQLAVNLSGYEGGASIGSYLCRRAGEREIDFMGLYAFVPTYDFTQFEEIGNAILIENDFMAWLGVMRRVNHLFKLDFDLSDLQQKSERLIKVVARKVEELDRSAPGLGVKSYMEKLSADFTEELFIPLDDVWGEALEHLLDDSND